MRNSRRRACAAYYGRGDASTALALPRLPGHARIVLDGYVDGQPFPLCPRRSLRAMLISSELQSSTSIA